MATSSAQSSKDIKPLQKYSTDKSGATVIPASKRPDGSMRKPIRVKEGYVPQEEIPVYQSGPQRTVAFSKDTLPVGYDPVVAPDTAPKEPSKMALKRQRAKAKKALEAEQAMNKTADQLSKLTVTAKKA
ncbi:hypothetical protein BV898_13485 [Hypsibius exemplaris]|uniref:Partner of Y14 and mago n=1 Tax=Hypsibius exemplaris TaxID=2072580 RepID=A0A1W0WAM6_HYPEX|nr:hypothetical protein BV898_13485 [Hypsibius exemplaris]